MNNLNRCVMRLASVVLLAGALVVPAHGNDGATDVTTGAKAWVDNCSRCHNMRDPQEFQDNYWRVIISHMRVRAGLTGKEARNILAFIQASNVPTGAGTSSREALILPHNVADISQADEAAGGRHLSADLRCVSWYRRQRVTTGCGRFHCCHGATHQIQPSTVSKHPERVSK